MPDIKEGLSRVTESLWDDYEAFRGRRLSGFQVEYLFLDAVYDSLREQAGVSEGILCAWGILRDGRRPAWRASSCRLPIVSTCGRQTSSREFRGGKAQDQGNTPVLQREELPETGVRDTVAGESEVAQDQVRAVRAKADQEAQVNAGDRQPARELTNGVRPKSCYRSFMRLDWEKVSTC